jgi:hypothetical protein
LGLTAFAAYFYKNARQHAEHLYTRDYPAPQYPVPHSEEEKEQLVRKQKRCFEIFYGFCFWLGIGMAGM